jgi:ABC-type lipoprotein export system ATPase subunit
MDTLLKVQNLTKTYHDGVTEFVAIRHVELSLQAGAFAALSGPSGCGKTTLLNVIGCIEVPDGGTVSFENHIVPFDKMTVLDKFRRENVGLVFQDFNLISVLTAYENVELPLLYNTKVSASVGWASFRHPELCCTLFLLHKMGRCSPSPTRSETAIKGNFLLIIFITN